MNDHAQAAIFQIMICYNLMMRTINQKQNQKELSPNRLSSDLYILSYKQNDTNLMRKVKAASPIPQASPIPHKQQHYPLIGRKPEVKGTAEQGQANGVAQRWRNIDRLVQMLKRGSKSKDKEESACGRLFKLIEKMHTRYWRLHSRTIKEIGFNRIKARSNNANQTPKFFLKESLEMRENEIQKGSKNFELNDLMHIVDMHHDEPTQKEDKLRNSLSRELIRKNTGSKERQTPSPSPKKVSNNVYILRRKTKEDLSTRQDLNSNTHISSDNFLPTATQTARSISPHSVDRSKSPHSIGDPQINLPNAHSQLRDNKLQELEIDSVKLDKSQELDPQELQGISNMKFPSFGLARPSQIAPVRTNRLMNPENAQRKIVFHYKNSEQKSTSPLRNEYFPPETAAKFIISRPAQQTKNANPLPVKKESASPVLHQEKMVTVQPEPARLQRISSLQVLHPKSVISNQLPTQNNQQPAIKKEDEGSLESRRCYSMPKITFTYKAKEQPVFVNPSPNPQHFQKNSPIFVLNQLKTSNKNVTIARQVNREDPYLSKNIQITTNIARQAPIPSPINRVMVYPANVPIENHYNMPVNNYVAVNPYPRPERLKIFSNHQTQPTTSFISNQPTQQVRIEEYYGEKEKHVPTQDTIVSPNRQRVRSTDTYVLTKPKPNLPIQQNINYASIERERARSCGIKMEIVSRKAPMIRVC